jgi:site-specific recombinase XerD
MRTMNTPSKRLSKRPQPKKELGTPPRTSWSAATIQFLTQSEMRALLASIDSKRDAALFLLAYRHGLRASEVGLLRVEDLDMQQYRLRIQRLKHSLSGLHPLQPDEVKALKAYLRVRGSQAPPLFLSKRNEPISRRMLDKLMKTYGKKAQLPETKRHFHCLKHSIATHLLDAGADLRFVQDWIGHASIKNTVIYAQLTSRRRDEEARKVFASQYVV